MNKQKSEIFFDKVLEFKSLVLLLFGFVCLFGFYSLGHIKIDAIPDITNKQVIVNTKTFSMDPGKVEKFVTYPIEAELYGIEGLIEMRSISKFGLSQIILIFKDDTDIHFARNLVIQRISTLKDQLPANISPNMAPLTTGIGEIIIYRVFDPDKKNNLTELRALQEYKFSRELKKISGVAEVDTIGGFERQLHLNVNSAQISKYGMTTNSLIFQLQTLGENFGGGYIEQNGQQKIVRTFANINNIEDIMNVGVKVDYTGKVLPLRHVVEVAQDYSQRLGIGTYRGEETVIGTVMLQSGANAREVLIGVKKEIKKINLRNPNAKIELLYDRQFLIDSTVKTVMRNLAEGILLVVGVLCLVLGNIRIGLVVASSLIFCILILAACMKIFGISANLMSLGAIDFGLLVDSSVVLVEYLVSKMAFNCAKQEKSEKIAKCCAQVFKPIFIGILIISLVYVPILMFSGVEGKTFRPMAINVVIAMLASLLVAFFIMPVLAYFFIKPAKNHDSNFFNSLSKFYIQKLDLALERQGIVIISCLSFFILSFGLLFFMESDFLPQLNEGDLVYTIVARQGTSLSKTKEIILELEQKIINEKEIDKTFSRIGTGQSGLDPMPQNSGDIFLILKAKYKNDAKKIASKFYKKLKDNCLDCDVSQTQPIEMRFNEMLEGSRADLSLKIFGEDFDTLILTTEKIKNLLQKQKEIKTIEKDFVNSIRKGDFIDIVPDYKEIAKNQITISNLNSALSNSMAGIKIGNFYITEFPISIILHLSEKDRNKIDSIKNITIGLKDGGNIKLSEVSEIKETKDITAIPRIFGKRYSGLSIYLQNTEYDKFIKNSETEIAKNKILPDGYFIEWGGRFENLNSAKKQIFTIVPIILAIIFVLLSRMFSDLKKVLIIFSSVPFALSGAIILLFICQISITISVYIGFIALIGISLLNSIILIDTFKNNGDLKLTCTSRLRPILMTALVASLGFLPMSFGHGIGAEVQQPLAITVIGGIISSTIATLILSPVLLKRFITRP
jgi:cobalt-zinc-cadmium resistance protein CzcA